MNTRLNLGAIPVLLAICLGSLALSAQESEFFVPEQKPANQTEQQPDADPNEEQDGAEDSLFFPPNTAKESAGQGADAKPNATPDTPVAVPDNMTRTVQRQLDDVIFPALREQRDLDFLQAMGALVAKLDTNGLNDLETYSQGHGFSIRDHFTSILVKAIEQQEEIPVLELKLDVITYINDGLKKQIESELAELNQHPVMTEKPTLPNTWRSCEQLFWEVHVWKNRLENVKKLSEYGTVIQEHLLARAKKKNDVPTINRLEPALLQDFKVQQHYRKLIEGEAVLRIAELHKAAEALQVSEDFEERISAAFALELHGHFLKKLFTKFPPGSFTRTELNNDEVLTQCADALESGRASGKRVLEKALLLRRGAHWWFRGRYGSGTLVHGLLKSKDATKSEEKMFGLYMPKERPDPIGTVTSDNSISPGYDRRHYFTWAVEKRDLKTSYTRGVGQSTTNTTVKKTDNETVRQRQFW